MITEERKKKLEEEMRDLDDPEAYEFLQKNYLNNKELHKKEHLLFDEVVETVRKFRPEVARRVDKGYEELEMFHHRFMVEDQGKPYKGKNK